jgi:hypothetical protein
MDKTSRTPDRHRRSLKASQLPPAPNTCRPARVAYFFELATPATEAEAEMRD